MAKSNLKSINNNNVTQNSKCQVDSNYSFTKNMFMYYNFFKLYSSFFMNSKSSLFLTNNLNFSVHYYHDWSCRYVETKEVYIRRYHSVYIKFFFLNNMFSLILDYFSFLKFSYQKINFKSKSKNLCSDLSKKKFFKINKINVCFIF